jgi:hypothetical protein
VIEAVSTPETLVNFYELHPARTQKTTTFIIAAVRT